MLMLPSQVRLPGLIWPCPEWTTTALPSAPLRFVSVRFVLLRSALLRFALLRSALLRVVPLKSGRMSGFSSRHAFQASTPFLSIVTCPSFAVGDCQGEAADIPSPSFLASAQA